MLIVVRLIPFSPLREAGLLPVSHLSLTDRAMTLLDNATNDRTVFSATNKHGGIGLWGESDSSVGVYAVSQTGDAVYGSSSQYGIHGKADHNSGLPIALFGETSSSIGVGALGNNYATSGNAQGVQGTSDSPRGWANTGWARHGGTGVIGVSGSFPYSSVPARTGVFGESPDRGGVFVGGKSQVRLVPSSAATHPSTGLAGDLFMDKSHRLWVCKGGSTWVKLA
jgi:hypothetical protein